MTSSIKLTHGARLLLKNSQKINNVFIRRIHNTKFEINYQLNSFPRSFLNDVPKNVINSNIKLGSIIIQRGLATVTAIDTKVPDIPVLTDTKKIAAEAAKAIANTVQATQTSDNPVVNAFNEKRRLYNENYWINVNFELFKNFPEWLDGLGLKLLAPIFQGKPWEDIINYKMTDLELLGVPNKNLRKRLLRHIRKVRDSYVYGAGSFAMFLQGKKWEEIIELKKDDLTALGIKEAPFQDLLIRGFAYEKTPRILNEKAEAVLEENNIYFRSNYFSNTDVKLLEDFPKWLDGLGLKPLSVIFEGKKWQDIVNLTSKDLMHMGIFNANLRRRLTKNLIKAKKNLAGTANAVQEIEVKEGEVNDSFDQKAIIAQNINHKTVDLYFSILNDVPCMLNTFEEALGRYYPYFEGKKWDEIIKMTDQDLVNLGVQDVGVRKMMVKGFEKQKKLLLHLLNGVIEQPPPPAPVPAPAVVTPVKAETATTPPKKGNANAARDRRRRRGKGKKAKTESAPAVTTEKKENSV
ncbi:11228_t:CDS:2 [Diversispora eburnea]|uniref:11228_t:CDS:1 n=1 Tax=Diversispora eburnea TaxID=1213867 RepID=A0A9N8ZSR8_9GLOM|nr:11228_t:CDS:2 [Diversispora eburnea]